MAATFRSVSSLIDEPIKEEMMTASSPLSITSTVDTTSQHTHLQQPPSRYDDSKTPTRATFGASADQQPPPPHPSEPKAVIRRENSQHSTKSSRRDSMDMDVDDSDGETGIAGEDGAASDGESVGADSSKSGKKKKSQRFYCTDYPPCNLSFTRSEHLARHIRKHTGERPFQCHCSRRFSRLDNLRQHAQTVHVNEDIPMDSLAATGSRFQRQMRTTERVRQAGNRARASTGGSAGGPVRGHSKSLSTSSVTSMSSVGSGYGIQPDVRRRPPPLVMTADPRARLSMESYRSNADSTYSYRPGSPGDFSTPTSATFSTAQSSPRWGSGMGSPSQATHSRSQSMYSAESRTPGRRLSVPSAVHALHAASSYHLFGPGHMNSSHPAAFGPPAPAANMGGHPGASPASSTSGWSARRESMSSNSDEAWRRRTWHPDSRHHGNQPVPNQASQLNMTGQAVRPHPPPPMANPSSSQSSFRLPGIESFDPLPPRRPTTPPLPHHTQQQQQQRGPSPMSLDPEPHPYRRPYQPGAGELSQPDERRNLNMYDASLQRGLNRLDISHKTPPRDSAGAWASEANRAVQAKAEAAQLGHPTVRFEDQPPPSRQYSSAAPSGRSLHHYTMSAPSTASARDSKRHGWYHGPTAAAQSNPPQQDQRVAHVDRMVHPNFTGFSGFPAREPHPPPPQSSERPANGDSLRRLEALVAVATSEGSTATAY